MTDADDVKTDLSVPETAPVEVSERRMGAVDQSFYIIGVGASAGGLDAIKQLISQVPSKFPHSLVIVQHISPDYKSLMSEILARETSLPVCEVSDNMAVEAGNIYLIPPRSNIVIQGTKGDSSGKLDDDANANSHSGLRFSLIAQTPRPGLNLPIDVFFHSLAEAVRDRSIAVVLSGSGSDGSRGLRGVKDREGFVLVQDPKMAAFDGMPRSAIATGIVDLVLAPDIMIGEINRYIEMRVKGIDSVERVFSTATDEFAEMLVLVSEKAEIDFSLYKEPTLKRRIARRMALRGYSTLAEYLAHLRREPAELNVLYREFLVGVTNFFRDLPVWRHMEETILPELFREGHSEDPVRVWSAGCSTGEEAYTIAMLLEHYRIVNDITRDFRIFATDVNAGSIQTAKQGIYPDSIREEIPDEYLKRGYLSLQSGTFTVAPTIRNKIVFAVHNVTEDAPYTRTDLVVCRNLLIYLSPDVQAKIMTHFSFSLRKNGFLQLGAAETPGQHGAMFDAIAHKSRIYRNTRQIDSITRRASRTLDFPAAQFLPRSRRVTARSQLPGDDLNSLLTATLEDAVACICIVDDGGKVIRTFGDHSKLLHIPDTGFSANLLELVDERLRSAAALLLRRSETEGKSEKKGVRLVNEQDVDIVDISCRKLPWEGHAIVFAMTFRLRREIVQQGSTNAPVSETPNMPTQAYIQHLESDVQSLQDMLSATAEDLGASNEELQTTNEELIASNEELQANNEETQSINEELHTLNAENAEKISELEAATGDINNLLATADLGVLVLDDQLCIRQFSAGLNRYVHLEEGDVGRPLENFATTLEPDAVAMMMDDVKLSRDHGEENTREMRGRDGSYVFSRVRPYRNVHGDHKGVVITLQDITDLKLLEIEVRQQRDRLEGLLESEAAGYWDWNIPEDTCYMSPRYKSMCGYDDHEIENTLAARDKLIHPDDIQTKEDALAAHVSSRGQIPFDIEIRFCHKDGSTVWVMSRGRVVEWSNDHQAVRMMGVHVDITHLKERELDVQNKADEIRRFAFIAAHDLLQPMNTIESGISMLVEDHIDISDDEQRELCEFLTESSIRMKERIDGILDYARLQDEALALEKVDLTSAAQESVADLKAQIDDAKAEISIGELPTALGTRSLISRVLLNLISNAVKYRRSDRICKVTIEAATAPGGMVGVRISDNGIGISPEYHKKIFELFARLHTDAEYTGSGLGLSLCERIVSKLGGNISVEDGVDGGSAFVFTLQSD
ncbi:MAG: chemotaxis protein CheB [Paracoccaceae bacterium]